MADQPDVFSEQQSAPVTPEASNPASAPDASYADLLASIKNEQGQPKYDSLPKALEGLANAQQYIPQLKQQLQEKEAALAELQAKLQQTQSVEEIIERLQNQNQPPAAETPSQASGLDQQAVTELVRNLLVQEKVQMTAEQNKAQVNNTLLQKFGEKAPEVMAAKAKELGTTPKELGELASRNPAMVLALFNTSTPSVKLNTATSYNTQLNAPERQPLQRPEKSLLKGATSKEQAEFMRRIREEVYAQHGITQ